MAKDKAFEGLATPNKLRENTPIMNAYLDMYRYLKTLTKDPNDRKAYHKAMQLLPRLSTLIRAHLAAS